MPEPPERPLHHLASLALVGAALGGCASAGALGGGPSHDTPVPADEPREEAALILSLPAGPQCEERFDLELYRDTGVDLVTWDAAEGCRDRRVVVRFLPRRLGREALLARVRSLSVPGSVRESTAAAPESPESKP